MRISCRSRGRGRTKGAGRRINGCIPCPGVPAIADIGPLLAELDAARNALDRALNERDTHQRNYASAIEREHAANRRIAELEAELKEERHAPRKYWGDMLAEDHDG